MPRSPDEPVRLGARALRRSRAAVGDGPDQRAAVALGQRDGRVVKCGGYSWQVSPDLVAELNAASAGSLGARLRAARTAQNMTQPDLARDAISVTYLSRIERGERRPGPELLELLCRRLDVTPESVIRGFDAVDLRQLELDLDFAALALATGDADRALQGSAEVAGDPNAAGDPALVARASLLRADALAALGRTPDAVAAYQQCLAAYPSSAHWPAAAIAASRVLRETGDLRKSASIGEAALERLEGTELAGGEEAVRLAVTHAATLYELGEVERARVLCETAIAAADALGSDRARAAAYWNSSVIESEAGNIDRALSLARTALALLEGRDESRNVARLRTQLAEILLRTVPAEVEAAIGHLQRAAEDYRWGQASEAERMHHQITLARARLLAGDADGATQTAQAVLDTVHDLPFVAASAATLLGQVTWAAGAHEQARDYYAAAIRHLTAVGADRHAAQLWFDLASLLDEAGLTAEANDAYRRAAAASGYSARANPFSAAAVSETTVRP